MHTNSSPCVCVLQLHRCWTQWATAPTPPPRPTTWTSSTSKASWRVPWCVAHSPNLYAHLQCRQLIQCLPARLHQEQEESLKDLRLSPVRENNVELLQEILRDLDPFKHSSNTAAELAGILTQPHFQVWSTDITFVQMTFRMVVVQIENGTASVFISDRNIWIYVTRTAAELDVFLCFN